MAGPENNRGSSSMDCGDEPPVLSVTLNKLRDLPKETRRWSNDHSPVDILLLTVEDCEFLACYYYLSNPFKSYEKSIGHVYFGQMGEDEDESLKVALVKCLKGSSDPGGSQTVTKNAVTLLRPKATFSVGFCNSLNPEKAKLGDVVISSKLTTDSYTIPVSRNVGNLVRLAADGWEAPLENPETREVRVHCDGEILSSSDLIGAEQQRQLHPKAIAVEIEGKGLWAAAHDMKVEWIFVKGVCNFADQDGSGSTNMSWKTFACVMAASVVSNMLSNPFVFSDWPYYGDSVPIYVQARGTAALAAYYRALESGRTYDKRIMIFLIGQDRVGKTSLGKCLRGEPFDKYEASTAGVDMIPPVKNAGKGPWRNPASLESTSALDHKSAAIVTEELLRSSTEQSDLAGQFNEEAVTDEKTREEITRDETCSEVPATEEPKRDVFTQETSKTDGTQDDRNEQKPKQMPTKVASLVEHGLKRNSSSDNEGIWPVIWDFAGQALHLAIHPMFLSQEAIYVLVSDLTKDLSAPAQCRIRPHDHDELEVESPNNDDTNLDHIIRWLDLVHSLRTPNKIKQTTHTGGLQSNGAPLESLPPVILVGTHADIVRNFGGDPCSKMKSVKKTVIRMIPCETEKHIAKELFVIDNTKAGKLEKNEDPEIVSLRQKILDVARNMPHTSREIPLQWLSVEEEIDAMVRRGECYIGKQKFKQDVADKICKFNDKDDLEELLHFLQARGTVIYHDLPENLEGLVVLNPKWLITVLSEIIKVNPTCKEESCIQKHYDVLEEKGLLSNELINQALKKLNLEGIKESLLHIMEKFDLICNSEGCRGEDYPYIVPCMLKVPKKKTRSQRNGPLPVYLTFDTNYVPSGLFCRLIVLFWKWAYQLCNDKFSAPTLFANIARFSISDQYHLTLESYKSVIKLEIWQLGSCDLDEEQQLCEELLSHLEYCKNKLHTNCHWLRSVSLDLFVQCKLCKPCPDKCHKETDICIWHKQQGCSHADCGHYIPLERRGLSCDHAADTAPSFSREKLQPWTEALKSIEKRNGTSSKTRKNSTRKRKGESSCGKATAPKQRKLVTSSAVKQGVPSYKDLQRLSQEIAEKWKPLGRRLNIKEPKLKAFHTENENLSEKSYQMLLHWRQKEGSGATYKVLRRALCDSSVNRKDLAERICCRRHK